MHVLLVAPHAPPQSGAEPLQVLRLLKSLSNDVSVTLVTTANSGGWNSDDPTLVPTGPILKTITLSLPLHRLSAKAWRRLPVNFCRLPDSGRWQELMTAGVLRQLNHKPDVIYSRSGPFSGALLALALKRKLGRPWLMHLSDPWAGSPYRRLPPRKAHLDEALEAECVSKADHITFTTEGQARLYRDRYPWRSNDISVIPNMYDQPVVPRTENAPTSPLIRIVHTGALYGDRDPAPLLAALSKVRERNLALSRRVTIEFIGNVYPEVKAQIETAPECKVTDRVSFQEALAAQRSADLLLSIEPVATSPFHPEILLAKVVDYLTSSRPILALAARDSVTAEYCRRGFGWAFDHADIDGLANFLEHHVLTGEIRRHRTPFPPDQLAPDIVTASVERLLKEVNRNNCAEHDA